MAQESHKRDTDETGYEPLNHPIQCANNCGFFGSASTNNLCSECYKDSFLKQSSASNFISLVEKVPAPLQVEQLKETLDKVENQVIPREEGTSSQNPEKPTTNRCSSCQKRVGLTGFKCRCGRMFCSVHRYSDKHNCPFDYKRAGQDAIAKENPVLKLDKIEKI